MRTEYEVGKSLPPGQAKRRLWATWILLLALLSGCAQPQGETDGDGTTEPGGVQALATRLFEQIAFATSTPDPSATVEAVRDPVVLDLSLNGELPDLDPGRAESAAQLDLTQNLFAGLTNYNTATDTIEPELATSWEVGPDGRTWTFQLRDDIYWVRGRSPRPGSSVPGSVDRVRAITADDVVFAIQRLCARETQSPLAYSMFIIQGCEQVYTLPEPTEAERNAIGIRAIDPVTLEVQLTRPAGYFLTLTSMPFFQPVPRDLVTELGDEWLNLAGDFSSGWQTPENLVTSGPFFPATGQTSTEAMTLHRNPEWPLGRTGNADVIEIVFLDDDMEAYGRWQERTLDIAPLPTAERESFLERTPEKVRIIPDPVLFYIGFNFQSQVFREPEVRRAFSAAIDRQVLVDEIYGGRGIIMRHTTATGVVATLPVDEVGVGYSPDYARQQMAESTFRSCRLLPEITLLVSTADLSLRQAELLRDMWVEELGCLNESIRIEQAQFGALLVATHPDAVGRPDMWELAWAPAFPDAHNLLTNLLHCEESENRQNRECSEADDLMRRAATVVEPAERTALYRQAESLFFSESGIFPIGPLYIRAREIIIHDWIEYTPVAFGGQHWDRVVVDATLKELQGIRQ